MIHLEKPDWKPNLEISKKDFYFREMQENTRTESNETAMPDDTGIHNK